MIGRIIAYIFATLIGLLGLLFVLASASDNEQTPLKPLVMGLFFLAICALIFYVALKKRPQSVTRVEVTQQVDLAGDTELEKLKCQSCGADISGDSVRVANDGSVLVSCPYCNSSYQITEKPKW